MLKRIISLLLLVPLTSCGRFGPPLPPEQFAPQQLSAVQVLGEPGGVSFEWSSPERDQRGEELLSLDGYRIYRLELSEDKDPADLSEYELLTEIPDRSVSTREELRAQARLEGKSTRHVKVDDSLKRFRYSDTSVEAGKTYLYRLVPFNQEDVESQTDKVIRVAFRGSQSQVSVITLSSLLSLGEEQWY